MNKLRPAFRYYGGKNRLAPWIIGHFPPHYHYVEPCAGAASVLLSKPLSPVETMNDLNGDIVNFFKVLRERTSELCNAILWTPHARAEYELSKEPATDELERARRWWVFCATDIGAQPENKRSGSYPKFRRDHAGNAIALFVRGRERVVRNLFAIARRLRSTIIESRPALDVMRQLDSPKTLIYLDPPYVSTTRTHESSYAVEWTDDDHRQMVECLLALKSMVILSGYDSGLYVDLESAGWWRSEIEAQTTGENRREVLWLSPNIRRKQATLF